MAEKPKVGRPRKPAEVEARAVDLAGRLGSSEEAARRLAAEGTPVDASSVRGWVRQARKRGDPPAKDAPAPWDFDAPPPPPVAPSPAPRPAPPDPAVTPPPPGLTPRQTRLWIVDQEIAAVRLQLAKARQEGAINTASLGGELRKLLDDRDELSPKEEADPAAEERRWSEEAQRVRGRIEAGVRRFEEG